MCCLPNPSPTSKLQVPPRGINPSFDILCDIFCVISQCQVPAWMQKGVSEGDVPPSEARKFSIFETGIVQFDEYFWALI